MAGLEAVEVSSQNEAEQDIDYEAVLEILESKRQETHEIQREWKRALNKRRRLESKLGRYQERLVKGRESIERWRPEWRRELLGFGLNYQEDDEREAKASAEFIEAAPAEFLNDLRQRMPLLCNSLVKLTRCDTSRMEDGQKFLRWVTGWLKALDQLVQTKHASLAAETETEAEKMNNCAAEADQDISDRDTDPKGENPGNQSDDVDDNRDEIRDGYIKDILSRSACITKFECMMATSLHRVMNSEDKGAKGPSAITWKEHVV